MELTLIYWNINLVPFFLSLKCRSYAWGFIALCCKSGSVFSKFLTLVHSCIGILFICCTSTSLSAVQAHTSVQVGLCRFAVHLLEHLLISHHTYQVWPQTLELLQCPIRAEFHLHHTTILAFTCQEYLDFLGLESKYMLTFSPRIYFDTTHQKLGDLSIPKVGSSRACTSIFKLCCLYVFSCAKKPAHKKPNKQNKTKQNTHTHTHTHTHTNNLSEHETTNHIM